MLALHDASCEAVMLNFVPQDAGNTGVVAVTAASEQKTWEIQPCTAV